jgi:hypothetical protein
MPHCLTVLLAVCPSCCREQPATRVRDDPPLDIVSIDNLPSVLALEASHAFADLLLPALMAYPQDKGWTEAQKVCCRAGGGGEGVTRRHVCSQQQWHCLPGQEPTARGEPHRQPRLQPRCNKYTYGFQVQVLLLLLL